MLAEVVTFEALKELSGYEQPAEVASWCTANEVIFFYGKYNRPATTCTALNSALGLGEHVEHKPTISVS